MPGYYNVPGNWDQNARQCVNVNLHELRYGMGMTINIKHEYKSFLEMQNLFLPAFLQL